MDIPDDKYDRLLAFIESGSKGDLPQDMIAYVELLDMIRGLHMRYKDRQGIVRFLQQPPYSLSYYLATLRYSEAINFFYLDHEISRQAWRNVSAEKLDRAADLVLKTATCAKDIDIYKNILYAAMEARQLSKEDAQDIPEDLFKKPVKIYTLDPDQIGRRKANRNLLARHIDSLDIPEAEKQRARSDAMIEDVEFLPGHELEED